MSISIYHSFGNVSQTYGNNSLSIYWPNNSTYYTMTLADGGYTVPDINYAIQQFCVVNGLYMMDSTGKNVYFVECVTNSNRYAVQLNFYTIPTTSQASSLGYTLPSSASWSLSASSSLTPTITFSSAFGKLFGFGGGTYPAASPLTSNVQLVSPMTPDIATVNSLIFRSNIIQTQYNIPNDVLYSIPLSVSYGSMITVNGNGVNQFVEVANNRYDQVELLICDQTGINTLNVMDTDCVIVLSLRKKQMATTAVAGHR